jgi:hypothetical protein
MRAMFHFALGILGFFDLGLDDRRRDDDDKDRRGCHCKSANTWLFCVGAPRHLTAAIFDDTRHCIQLQSLLVKKEISEMGGNCRW